MIESPFHPCDEIERWGYTAHGLMHGRFDLLLLVNGVDFPMPFEFPALAGESYEWTDTHLVRVPGIGDVDITREEFAAEQAAGRTWQNYSLLSTERLVLFGHGLEGWVCIDSTGARWLISADPIIRMMTFSIAEPLLLKLRIRPFGYLDEEPAAAVERDVTLANTGQVNDNTGPPGATTNPLLRQLRIGSISSDGRRAIIEIHGVQGGAQEVRRNYPPSGILLLELSGDGPNVNASLSVLRTQAQCHGTFTEQRHAPQTTSVRLEWDIETTPREPLPGFPGLDVVASISGVSPVIGGGGVPSGEGWIGAERRGRVAALVFDDANGIVEFTYDVTHRVDYKFPAFVLESSSGQLAGWIGDSWHAGWLSEGGARYSYGRSSSEVMTADITIRRSGVVVAGSQFRRSRSIREWRRSVEITSVHVSRPDLGVDLVVDEIGTEGFPDALISFTESVSVGEGAGSAAWTLTRDYEGATNYAAHAMYSALTATLGPLSWGYGGAVSSAIGGEHAVATLLWQRYSNHLFGVRVHLAAGTSDATYRVNQIAGTQGVWLNPDPANYSPDWYATYHPVTHEIYVESGVSGSSPDSPHWAVYL